MPGKKPGEGDGGCPGQRLGNFAERTDGAGNTKEEGDLLERKRRELVQRWLTRSYSLQKVSLCAVKY